MTILYVVIALFIGLFSIMSSNMAMTVRADGTESTYSNVLDDLKKDSNFDENKYPSIVNDYSVELITIAEGEHTEVFVYVYMPSYETTGYEATSINISTKINAQLSYWNYELRLINTNGVFQKYVVEDLYVSANDVRHYDISSIFREWNEKDSGVSLDNGNEISEIAFNVAKIFTFENS